MPFFEISFGQLNLFSIVLGAMWGLASFRWNPWKPWLWIVVYFAGVALYYYLKSSGLLDGVVPFTTLTRPPVLL
jgi:hypothetical protein